MTDYRTRLEAALTAGNRWFADNVRVGDLRAARSLLNKLKGEGQ